MNEIYISKRNERGGGVWLHFLMNYFDKRIIVKSKDLTLDLLVPTELINDIRMKGYKYNVEIRRKNNNDCFKFVITGGRISRIFIY